MNLKKQILVLSLICVCFPISSLAKSKLLFLERSPSPQNVKKLVVSKDHNGIGTIGILRHKTVIHRKPDVKSAGVDDKLLVVGKAKVKDSVIVVKQTTGWFGVLLKDNSVGWVRTRSVLLLQEHLEGFATKDDLDKILKEKTATAGRRPFSLQDAEKIVKAEHLQEDVPDYIKKDLKPLPSDMPSLRTPAVKSDPDKQAAYDELKRRGALAHLSPDEKAIIQEAMRRGFIRAEPIESGSSQVAGDDAKNKEAEPKPAEKVKSQKSSEDQPRPASPDNVLRLEVDIVSLMHDPAYLALDSETRQVVAKLIVHHSQLYLALPSEAQKEFDSKAILPATPIPDKEVPASHIPVVKSHVYGDVGSGHWINEVSSNGRIVTLEDESVWEIEGIDQIDTVLWLPVTDITVIDSDDPAYPYLLINKEDGETAHAKLISR